MDGTLADWSSGPKIWSTVTGRKLQTPPTFSKLEGNLALVRTTDQQAMNYPPHPIAGWRLRKDRRTLDTTN